MKQHSGELSFRFDEQKGLSISLKDNSSKSQVIKIDIQPNDVAKLFANETKIKNKFVVLNLDQIGKKHSVKIFEFPLKSDSKNLETKRKIAREQIFKIIPKDYRTDGEFKNIDAFFEKDGKPWARCLIVK